MTSPAPITLGRYKIEKEIGRGMMGVVYRASDPDLGRTVALKIASVPPALPEEQRLAFEQRFLQEARAAAGLAHPALVVVHDVGRDPATNTPYIALEYLQGETLAARLSAGPLPVPQALSIARRLAEALHHAHSRGVVHRDVKPANIMILPSGEPKVMDFGIAKLPASQLTTAGESFGTPSYMSPEQALSEPLDGRSDLFSLGSVLYAMLTGERAFEADSVPQIMAKVAYKNPLPPSSRNPAVRASVDAIVLRLLAKDRERRYPDGKTLAEDLEDAEEGRPPRHRPASYLAPVGEGTAGPGAGAPMAAGPAPPLVFAATPKRSSRRDGVVLAAIACGVVSAAVGLWLFLRLLQAAGVPVPLPPPSARLALHLEHSLKNGTARVFVDDELEFEETLESRVVQKILALEIRKGTLEKTIAVAPGDRVIRVQVQGDNFTIQSRITGRFASDVTRRLRANVGGILKKDVDLVWLD